MRIASLVAAAAVAVLAPTACGSKSSDPQPDAGTPDTRPPTPPEWDRPVTRPDDTTATSSRATCKFARGALPAETLGASTPIDSAIPIDTVIVLMMENR